MRNIIGITMTLYSLVGVITLGVTLLLLEPDTVTFALILSLGGAVILLSGLLIEEKLEKMVAFEEQNQADRYYNKGLSDSLVLMDKAEPKIMRRSVKLYKDGEEYGSTTVYSKLNDVIRKNLI